MHELRFGLWHWQARHPEWTEDEPWDPEVSSYALDDGTRLLLFDPDTLADFGQGIEIHDEWLWGVTGEQVVEALRPLVALPVELVRPAHGATTDRAALERALA